MDKKFWASTFTLTGTIIGAGILGLPYVFAKSGFLVGLFWLILIGSIMLLVNLYLGEISLRMAGERHQLASYAKKYLGKIPSKMMVIAMVFGIYSALIAYLIGQGQSFSRILPGNTNPIILAFVFWILMTFLLGKGIRGLKKIETWGVLGIILILIGICIYFLPSIEPTNLLQTEFSNFFLPFGVVLFSLMGFSSIPLLRREINNDEKKFKKAIILGITIPIILYGLFTLTFIGILGKNISQIATLSFNGSTGKFLNLLGIFTMLTSYIALSFSLKDLLKFDLKFSKKMTFLLTSMLPLIIYFIISLFNIAGFIEVLGAGGVISGGTVGILILFANKKSKKIGKRKPEFSIPINWFIIILLGLIFVLGVLTEVLSFF